MTPAVLDVTRPESANSIGTELAESQLALITRMVDTTITDDVSCEQQVQDRQVIKDAIDRRKDFFGPFKLMAHRLHRALCDREADILQPLLRLDAAKRDAIQSYHAQQQRLRRQREQEEADQQRYLREQHAATEAAALEAAGEQSMADAVLAEAIAAPAPVVVLPDTTKQIAGLKLRRTYLWRYVGDKDKAAKIIPREFLCVDEQKIGAFARSMKGSGTIPGIEFYSEDVPIR